MFWYSLFVIVACLAMSVIVKFGGVETHDPTAAGYFFAATVLLPVFLNALYARRATDEVPVIDTEKTKKVRIKIGLDALILQFEKNQVHVTHIHGDRMTCGGFRLDVLSSDYFTNGWPACMRLWFRWQEENDMRVFDPIGSADAYGELWLAQESEEITLPATAIRYGGLDPDRMERVWVKGAELFPQDKPSRPPLIELQDKVLVAPGEAPLA